MRKRKLQVFLSSTYEDLIDHRLAAMEAILAAGHIPAAMEQFAPGDETAWEIISRWIDGSDAFILILGGRYGSIEPVSGKSYVQLEYEYAVEKKKPFFALIIAEGHHEQRVRTIGLSVDEREHQQQYKEFRDIVAQRLCRFWNDQKDIQNAIFHKLPEWAQRTDLIGWVRGDEAADPEVMNELARLSQENRELRASAVRGETFDGLTLEEIVRLMAERQLTAPESLAFREFYGVDIGEATTTNLLEAFESAFDHMLAERPGHPTHSEPPVLNALIGLGIIERRQDDRGRHKFLLTDTGRRLRNRLMAEGRWRTQQDG